MCFMEAKLVCTDDVCQSLVPLVSCLVASDISNRRKCDNLAKSHLHVAQTVGGLNTKVVPGGFQK